MKRMNSYIHCHWRGRRKKVGFISTNFIIFWLIYMFCCCVFGTFKNFTGFTAIHRHPDFLDGLASYKMFYNGTIKTGWDVFQHGLELNPDAPCIGTRTRFPDESLGDYEFKSYRDVETIIQQFGSGLLKLKAMREFIYDEFGTVKVQLLGVYASNCFEWLVCEQVCNGYGLTIVPIYDTLGEESTKYILENSDLNVIVCDLACARKLIKVIPKAKRSTVRVIIVTGIDRILEDLIEASVGVDMYTWNEIITSGAKDPSPFNPATPDKFHTISYTSGTAGVPKGVIITQEQIATLVTTVIEKVCDDELPSKAVNCYLSYLPLAHMYERLYINNVYFIGGRIGIYSGDIRNILEDLKVLKPTVFVSVPRLFSRIHDKVFSTINQKSFLVRWLFKTALNAKLQKIKEGGDVKHTIWDKLIFHKFPALFGGNVMWMMTGSAPLSPLTYDRIRAIFSTTLVSGYGLTEICAGGFHNKPSEIDPTHVGGPVPCIEFRLRSVPDFEYYVTDPNPRGELLLRGNTVTLGYFKNNSANAESFLDGWLLTGDIVELLPNGSIKIIDRRKNLFKLGQGEYLSPEKLEGILTNCRLITQAFVTGDSQEIYPVAIVVPDETELRIWATVNKMSQMTVPQLCKTPELMQEILKQMNEEYEEAGVKGFEKCKNIYIEPEPFSIENQLLTSTSKLRRNIAQKVWFLSSQ
ncbi:bifunctional AMP-dependent synthetase-ligase/ANL [Babesia duncani]|uniref:Bifunctional AMP-dependent synthetase-ligase/ANL n=1 Tax=Babesia duncani TaxID=323732 RepID=A0AAD9PLM8_9APIC|nr:bifunctional AMP-dependent synthetase-ligase/ANL [Babesia duncani]